MRKAWIALLLVVLCVPGIALARSGELIDPGPIAVPAEMAEKAVVSAIKRALGARTWVVSKQSPGLIEASLYLRAHVARIAIAYDAEAVRISYVSSDNLNYTEKDGRRIIHSNYLGWIGNLVVDISRNLHME